VYNRRIVYKYHYSCGGNIMKLDMSKWKALSIKNRLKKGFRLTTFVASASGVIAGILMILVSMRYSSALTFYGFSQGDIGKVMVTFSETRSATRALIGYTSSDTLSKMSDTQKGIISKILGRAAKLYKDR
jgi:methyl-accepting chemotaxis protein